MNISKTLIAATLAVGDFVGDFLERVANFLGPFGRGRVGTIGAQQHKLFATETAANVQGSAGGAAQCCGNAAQALVALQVAGRRDVQRG